MLSFTAHESKHHLRHGQLHSIFYGGLLHIWNPPIQSRKECQGGEILFCRVSYKGGSRVNSIHKITADIFQLAERLHRSKHTVAPHWSLICTVLVVFILGMWCGAIAAAMDRRIRSRPCCFPPRLYRPAVHLKRGPGVRRRACSVRAPLRVRSSLAVRRSPRAHFRRRAASHRQEILHKFGVAVVQPRGRPGPGRQSRAVGRGASVLNVQLVNKKYSELSILDLFFQNNRRAVLCYRIFLFFRLARAPGGGVCRYRLGGDRG